MNIVIVGVGPIGIEYAKIFKALGHQMLVLGRSEKGCAAFLEATGIEAVPNGLVSSQGQTLPATAVVAVSEAQLGQVVLQLIERGVKSILVEKPGAGTPTELRVIADAAAKAGCDVRVAYNRRFHASTQAAQRIIEEDGGVNTFHFEFTEWSHRIEPITKEPGVKEEWFFHNSSHVVDLAFYLGGWPKEMKSWSAGSLSWHPHARYAGAGISDKGALFSYIADWQGPGRWGVEVITSKHRLILKPLEKLQIQKIGSIAVDPIEIDDSVDTSYKPGFFRQVQAFLYNPAELLSIQEQVCHLTFYAQINPLS
ncbi:Gfo/Idh/MocA family protein [Rhodoferax sp.]|uniref:Gfo/Idh/MocA family protein n=1 Tax=Rhodoferax sp. TaxID=50421 RepID=UPI0008C93E46|nr:Gfo/Idh/MocA family oxidoreductase [Rhodoferax sp.]MDO8319261.1 Gfo/Idh/MocA family oxidoreductase [Rhodoferax sp.]MDP2680626.1 Gfo/Idh/MocA family oxidoreductase [Rhodoferax sp.]OGB50068.1 MAG: myo-inositol 2-dehydrogenase [Burkholderiales bacterium RIFOXYD12_FULL_59_19]OGB76987.1 MAG: myo-inositol 2-dehydrogenase [Burkholderiales bacterium RIFOXYC12_FULL_60_6]